MSYFCFRGTRRRRSLNGAAKRGPQGGRKQRSSLYEKDNSHIPLQRGIDDCVGAEIEGVTRTTTLNNVGLSKEDLANPDLIPIQSTRLGNVYSTTNVVYVADIRQKTFFYRAIEKNIS